MLSSSSLISENSMKTHNPCWRCLIWIISGGFCPATRFSTLEGTFPNPIIWMHNASLICLGQLGSVEVFVERGDLQPDGAVGVPVHCRGVGLDGL